MKKGCCVKIKRFYFFKELTAYYSDALNKTILNA